MSKVKYVQTIFNQDNSFTTAWVEDKNLKIGNQVELKGKEGLWDVLALGATSDTLNDRAYKDFQGSTRGGGIDE